MARYLKPEKREGANGLRNEVRDTASDLGPQSLGPQIGMGGGFIVGGAEIHHSFLTVSSSHVAMRKIQSSHCGTYTVGASSRRRGS